MRDPERIDRICAKLAALWKQAPDLRFHQLLINAGAEHHFAANRDSFYMEDDAVESALEGWEDDGEDVTKAVP